MGNYFLFVRNNYGEGAGHTERTPHDCNSHGWARNLEPCPSHMWLVGTQGPDSSSTVFLGTLAGS